MSSNGQARIGIRSAIVTNSPIIPTTTISASLLQSLYGAWNGDTTTNELSTSLYGVWNGEYSGTASLETSLYGAWNGEALGTSLDTSIFRVYNGDNVNDTSGNAQNGTNVNNVTFTTGKVGNAFTFNGSNYVTMPNNSFGSTGDFSISVWINPSAQGSYNTIFEDAYLSTGTNRYGIALYIQGSGVRFATYNGTGNLAYGNTSTVSNNTWQHIVITKTTGNAWKMYINNTLQSLITVVGNITTNPGVNVNSQANIGSDLDIGIRAGYFNGKIDGLTTWTKALTEAEITSLYNTGTGAEYPFSSQTLPSSNDSFGTNHGTLMNGTTFATGKIGQAFTFDGVNDFVRLPNNSLDLTGDFSISMWVNWSRNNTSQILMSNLTIGTLDYMPSIKGWFIEHVAGQLRFRGLNSSGGNAFYIYTAYTPPLNTWVHYTFVHKNSSNKMYADGVLIGSDTGGSTHVAYDTPNYPMIGANQYNSTTYQEFFLGKLDAVSVWNRELTSNEVSMLYNGSNGTQYSSGSFGLTQSSLDSFGTYHGNLINTTYGTGISGNAFQFNGTSAYVSMGTGAGNFGSNSFSISGWFYPNVGNVLQMLVAKGTTTATNKGFVVAIDNRYNSNQRALTFGLVGNNSNYQNITTTTTNQYTIGNWNHFTVVWDSTNKSMKIYLNGVQATTTTTLINGTGASGISDISNTSAELLFGQYGDNTSKFNGKLDSVTMWDRIVSVDEVTQLYNSGTGAQYPFTGTFSSAINQLGVDNGTLMNGCTFGDGKIGKAFQFDGVDDYVSLPLNSLNFTGDFSISAWVNFSGTSANSQTIVGNLTYDGTYGFGYYFCYNNNNLQFQINNTLPFSSGGYIILSYNTTSLFNTWNLVTVTRKSSTGTKMYINGSLVASNTNTSNPNYNSNMRPSIGVTTYGTTYNNLTQYYAANGTKIDAVSVWNKELTQSEITELYNSGNGKQITTTPIVQSGLVLNLDASRKSSYTGTGTNAYDSSYSNYSFSLANGVGYTASNGGSFTFIQNNYTYLDRNGGGINVGNKFTVQLWAKISKFGGNEGGTWKRAGFVNNSWNWSSNQGWALLASSQFGSNNADTPGKEFLTFSLGQDQWGFTTSYGSMTQYLNTWVNITVVVNGTNQLKAYINGVEPTYLYVQNGPGDGVLNYNLNYFYIGRTNQDNLQGSIGSFYMYNRPLSQTEIQQNFNVTKSRFGL